MAEPTSIKLALDWTPNTNHTPFLIALAKGFYRDAGLEVTIVNPADDNYGTTPAARLASSSVDLALAPSESVFAYRFGSSKQTPLRAIAAVLSKDASSIATLRTNNTVRRPRDLDGKIYASYAAKFEDAIVKAMIRADNGEGDIAIVNPPKLGIWETLLKGNADATWIFDTWEGVEAKQRGVELRTFRMGDYGVPYGYSPLLLENEDCKLPPEAVRKFLQASRKGLEFAQENPEEAGNQLRQFVPVAEHGLVDDSLRLMFMAGHFAQAGQWGFMEEFRWSDWVSWLRKNGLLVHKDNAEVVKVKISDLYSNEYLTK